MKRIRSKSLRAGLIILFFVSIAAIGTTTAYFTDRDEKINVFTVGSISVDLIEEIYDANPQEHEYITPASEIVKDPVVRNTGLNDAYVFVEFTMPKASVITVNDSGGQNAAVNRELFAYRISNGWQLVAKEETEDDCTYVYAYSENGICSVLASGEETPVLFEDGKIKFINIIEGQLTDDSLEIPITAYAIQTNNINGGMTLAEDVWEVLFAQSVTAVADEGEFTGEEEWEEESDIL